MLVNDHCSRYRATIYVDNNYLYMLVTYDKSVPTRIGVLCYKYDRKHRESICLCNKGGFWNVITGHNVFEAALQYLYGEFCLELRGECVRDFYDATLRRLHSLKL